MQFLERDIIKEIEEKILLEALTHSSYSNEHKDCENYNPKKDYCLKFFEENVSEKYPTCKEYSEFNDKKLSRKWSN